MTLRCLHVEGLKMKMPFRYTVCRQYVRKIAVRSLERTFPHVKSGQADVAMSAYIFGPPSTPSTPPVLPYADPTKPLSHHSHEHTPSISLITITSTVSPAISARIHRIKRITRLRQCPNSHTPIGHVAICFSQCANTAHPIRHSPHSPCRLCCLAAVPDPPSPLK